MQGVWYRASTREQATALNLTGYAKNLPDGRVEVIACGEASELEKLQAWLRRGPSGARVDEVLCEPHPAPAGERYLGFKTL